MKQHYRTLLTLGIPIVIGQIGVIVLGFADTLMIGHHSTTELAAASFVNNMFNLAIIFSTGFSYGLTPVVGSLFGRGMHTDVGRALKNSLAANTLLAVLVCAVMGGVYAAIPHMGQPEELIPYIRPYFLILLASIPFVLWFNGFKQFADGITDTKVPMWILLSGNILNIIGNYVLIYGKMGFPELGLCGAGISTLISRILMVVAFLVLFFMTGPLCGIQSRIPQRQGEQGRVPSSEQARLAYSRTDGYGNSIVQPQCHHDRMVGKHGAGIVSDYDGGVAGMLHDVLRHGSGCICQDK